MKAKSSTSYIVVFFDGDCLHIPMTRDKDCEGALQCSNIYDPVAVFPDRAAARKAIKISTAFAKLCKEQGKAANDDFLTYLKHIYIQPLSLNT